MKFDRNFERVPDDLPTSDLAPIRRARASQKFASRSLPLDWVARISWKPRASKKFAIYGLWIQMAKAAGFLFYPMEFNPL